MRYRPVRPLSLALLLVASGCALLRSGPPKPEPVFVSILGGTFTMGAPDDEDPYALPVHPVTVEPFEMMAREVTFAEFDPFADATDGVARPDSGDFGRGARAVVLVTWDEAAAFCDWIDARLPNEREWEWAARGGPAAQRYAGTDSLGDLARYAWFHESEPLRTTTAARRAPNPLGL
jgi:formylglycine-generating enzyme required for sulfatase activity